jgi:phage repressor protein C with HTH and peptisase S24 domain
LEGDILVKRLQRVPGGKIKVSSDNPAYEPFYIALEDGGVDFALLGRVVVAVDLKRL